jgi:hypothetical protein
MNLPDELLIEFRKPIKFDKLLVEAIQLEEPTIGQIEQAQKAAGTKGSLALIRELISLVAGQPMTIISQMKISDVNKASAYLMGFIESSAATTET